ncbi:MAG: HDIG domain-containing protein, partial [Candidatus Sumerlaeaceae bacterium]|nr:HDIG domain-containing protein [Candidatus Sumerlaeaceae bacterium]
VHAAGNAVVLLIAILFLAFYVRKFSPEFSFTSRDVLLLALPAITALCIGRFFINISPTVDVMPFAFPAGMLGMLSIILFGTPLALMLVVVTSLTFGLTATSIGQGPALGLDYGFVLASLVGGFTGVASLAAMKERRQVLLAGLWVAVANMITLLALALIRDPKLINTTNLIACAVNGIGCYVLTLGALPLFETLFGLSTDVRLMELTSTQHPLLRMMEEKAPGTFQHTLNVAKLAESAAEGVGANFLLVRAGAYFHDIGKMLHPKYFTENQATSDERRIHSRLSAYMSTLIVKNHVKEGIELAQEHRLPDRVVDFIPQHHGTSLIKYFYAQALEKAEPNEIVLEDEFRYPGPKPQSIEAAIVMVADSIDAIATAKLSGRTVREEDIQRLVRDTITEKFRDGQFDECHMTFRDMHLMTEALVRALLSRYHQRVDYPLIPQAREIRDITRPGTSEAIGAER